MVHPYGIAIADAAVFVTCQSSGQLIQFPMDDVFRPKILSMAKVNSTEKMTMNMKISNDTVAAAARAAASAAASRETTVKTVVKPGAAAEAAAPGAAASVLISF